MTILAFDSSAKECSAAVLRDGKIISSASLDIGLTHSETLLPLVDSALARAGIKLADVSLVAVTNGPGSFTGLRIGVATAKGLCWPDAKPVAAVPTTEALARAAASAESGVGRMLVLMDARRDRFYTAEFSFLTDGFARAAEDDILTTDELYEKYKDRDIILTGDGAELFGAAHPEFRRARYRVPAAVGAALAAEAMSPGEFTTAADAAAVYLRSSRAERQARGE